MEAADGLSLCLIHVPSPWQTPAAASPANEASEAAAAAAASLHMKSVLLFSETTASPPIPCCRPLLLLWHIRASEQCGGRLAHHANQSQ